eukprot:12869282-Ditylum_brightwellii.AAC.1
MRDEADSIDPNNNDSASIAGLEMEEEMRDTDNTYTTGMDEEEPLQARINEQEVCINIHSPSNLPDESLIESPTQHTTNTDPPIIKDQIMAIQMKMDQANGI